MWAALPWGKILVGVAIAIALALFLRAVYASGYKAGYAKLLEYKAAQDQATKETIREVEKVVTQVQVKYVDRIKVVKEKGDVIVQKVPEYIMVPDDAACELRNGFVRLHDGAARNQPPEPPGDSDRAPAGIALSQATAVIAENYATCHRWREQVLGWQEFWGRYSTTLRNAVCLPKEQP